MPADELESAREAFLHRLGHEGVEALGQQPLVSYWQSVEAEASTSEDLAQLDRWSKALSGDKEKIEALKSQAHAMSSEQLADSDALSLIRQILALLDVIEGKINHRLATLRDRLGRWVFLAGPGVKKKPPEEVDEEQKPKGAKPTKDKKLKQSLIQRAKPKEEPKKIKAI